MHCHLCLQYRKKTVKMYVFAPNCREIGIWAHVNKNSKITPTSSRLPKFSDAPPSDLRERCAREKNKPQQQILYRVAQNKPDYLTV